MAIYASADRQGSGEVALEGAVEAIRAIKERCPLSRAALDSISAVQHFERADINCDGVLSYDEFHSYVTRHILERAYAERQLAESTARKAALSQNAIIERRVAELAPGIATHGVHQNRLLLFGGAAPSTDAVLMRTNDYLRLSGHPTISAARAEAMVNEGGGEETRPRLFTMADLDRHRALELRLASLLRAEDAVLTMSGAHAMTGLLTTLRGGARGPRSTPIYSDRLSWTTACLRYGTAKPSLRRLVSAPV